MGKNKKSEIGVIKRFLKMLSGEPDSQENPEELYLKIDENDPIDVRFAKRFNHEGGKFIYCQNMKEAQLSLKMIAEELNTDSFYCPNAGIQELFKDCNLSFTDSSSAKVFLTDCECLVAFIGAVMISSKQMMGKKLDQLPEKYVVIADTSQFADKLNTGLTMIRERHSGKIPNQITTIHAPLHRIELGNEASTSRKELFLLLLEESIA
jgi:hypothetical protein